jgi:hypothetical protein
MVNMGVAQYNRINFIDIKWKWVGIASYIGTATLNHAVVEQDSIATRSYDMAATSNFASGAEKFDFSPTFSLSQRYPIIERLLYKRMPLNIYSRSYSF